MKINTKHIAAAVIAAFAMNGTALANPEAIAQKAGCLACHAKDKKILGPSYKEVAAKYKGQAGIAEQLASKVRAGGVGAWGKVPMPPNPKEKINDADLKTVVGWILGQ